MDLHNKKIAVLGLGREGQALAKYFRDERIVADYLDEQATDHQGFPSHKVKVGPLAFDNLSRYDLIFRSPGIAPYHPKIKPYQKKLTSLTKLFFELWPGRIIGVTGTKGKSTTSSLIKEILDGAQIKADLVGNIGNVNLLGFDQYSADSWAVMEMSSFQLVDLGVSPQIAVVLDISSDHLNYHGSIEEYQRAKLEITKHQGPDDWLVVTNSNPLRPKFMNLSKSQVVTVYNDHQGGKENTAWWDNDSLNVNIRGVKRKVFAARDLKIIGQHNQINASMAAAVGIIVGVKPDVIARKLSEFRGMPMRLENIGTFSGVTFINDSASTNPLTVAAAIRAMTKPSIFLVGGRNKGLDYTELAQNIAGSQNVKAVITYGEYGPTLFKLLANAAGKNIYHVAKMDEAVARACQLAESGDNVILSPGAASFDEFDNYQARGQKFNQLIYDQWHK
jgi:UDP-N-acetylmuramoylalanine--D-glutamate ligase